MAIRYEPKRVLDRLKKGTPGQGVSVKRLARDVIENTGAISRKKLDNLSLKVIKQYKEKYDLDSIDPSDKLAIQRIQNNAVYEIAQGIKENYSGESYEWLPSDADNPDPEHQLNYGKIFQVGVGEMPGDRPGCKCGMNILVNETRLNL
jgi:hypothetical protein